MHPEVCCALCPAGLFSIVFLFHLSPIFQIIFRKISDVKREEEEMLKRKNEAPLNLPVDHPVRRLFQRFRQQREARLASERAAQGPGDVERGSVPLERPRGADVLTSNCSPDTPCPPGTSSHLHAAATQKENKCSEAPRAKGWGRLKDSWSSVSESMDLCPDRTKSHQQVTLKKTHSCDSGITKSDLRLDNVGGARTPQEQSPVQCRDQSLVGPVPEQNLQASISELREELRGAVGSLNGRLGALEAQLLQLLLSLRAWEASRFSSSDSDKECSSS